MENKRGFIMRNGTCIGMDVQRVYTSTPIGIIQPFASDTNIPRGYLLCDGASYPTTDYPDLYAVIGNTYGGDTENFNVPNLVDKFIQGSSTSGTEKEAGLPNITGSISNAGATQNDQFLTDSTSAGIKTNGALSIAGYASKTSMANGTDNFNTPTGFKFDASKSNAIYGNSDTVQPPALTMVYIIKAFHTNEGTDSGVSDDVINYVDNKINDSSTNTNSTWSSSMIASQINNATAIKRSDVIAANATKETGWNLAQGESHFYGRLLQLDGHLGSKSSTFSFLLFVKANYDNPTTVYVTQLAGMDDDRSNIGHTTYFELGVSSSGNLTIKNKSAVAASYRFI